MTHTNEHGQPIGFPVEDWTQAQTPNRDTNQGSFVELHCARDTEPCAALLDAYLQDTKRVNWTYLPYGPFDKLSDFIAWYEKYCFNDDPLFHVVYDKSTQSPVGLASYLRINPVAGSIEVGHIHFSPLMQRTPMATETMYLMMKRAFDELDYRRYEWKCDALNKPSIQAAERLGFTYEGTFRQAVTYKQRNRDTAWLSVTDKEWPAVKAGFESWLAVDNFNSEGEQINSLQVCRAQALS